ncbi:heavy metal translocating P-type ATPase [Rhodocyclus tenuis]|uniref:P-type Zn(2+) transporter n=1 Tax=Rhodocyclus tenuis TaxID=1066 RepID=A0A840G2Z9_RHOTE|nr:heavy metal translocating P-type ATPase [Rhodocyclus tenuis]MBB4248724.1 heavy metal translocating P-type ATPase [Rhodocyclus tenuis]
MSSLPGAAAPNPSAAATDATPGASSSNSSNSSSTDSSERSPFVSMRVVHRLPGRLRLRFKTRTGAAFQPRQVQLAIENLAGVVDARINPAAASLIVRFDPAKTDAETLCSAIRQLPVRPSPSARSTPAPAGEEMRALLISGGLLLGSSLLPLPLRMPATLAAALPVFGEAVDDLLQRGITSHVLEALAIAISALRRDYTAANATSFMLALGEYLEHSIERRSDDLLKQLLRPDTGLVWVEEDGVERQIDSAGIAVGATVIVAAGATVPVDGTVLGGEALINEAAMTGESEPVRKQRGDSVLSGTVVEEGRLRVYAEHVGHRTAAARIADYVEDSLTAKSQAQLGAARLADRLVPAVLGLAGTTWLLSGDWQRAAAVLQADYSCALKLATPVAFKAGMYRSGKQGILFKGGDVVERLAEADTFVFDKTGTLTTGLLAVTDSITFDPNYSATDLIDLAASVEEHYFHPLALAVVEAARKHQGRHFDHKEVEFIAAHGVASVIDGQRIVVGSRHFVEEDEGIPVDAQRAVLDRLFREGKTLLYIGFGGRLLGVIALKDQLRESSAATLARLRRLGVRRIVMLTGDHRARAAELAEQLGIDEFHAELLPEGKAEIVARMTAAGARVAFVGDGINDAPALAGAHVGIAMQRGADLARLTADVALLEDHFERVADARELAVATMQRIDNNFRLTVGANTAILAAAAFGKLSPIASSVLHNGSTIAILLNALRSVRLRPE